MTNSRTYRSQSVESVELKKMLAGREGQSAVVGVDVGKEKLYMMVRWENGQTERPVVVLQPEELGVAIELLKGLAAGRKLRVAMEPSGTYGDPFRYACHKAELVVERGATVKCCGLGKSGGLYLDSIFEGYSGQYILDQL